MLAPRNGGHLAVPADRCGFIDPADLINTDQQWSMHNYYPLPVVISSAEGTWITDVSGRRHLDFLAGYSALNFGHRHPAVVAAAVEQLNRVTLTSRAFHHTLLGRFVGSLLS
jgi:ornithine--oxo-acid transaminase